MLGVGAILAAIIVLSLGLVCALLKQIMDGGAMAPQPLRPAYAGPAVPPVVPRPAAAASLEEGPGGPGLR